MKAFFGSKTFGLELFGAGVWEWALGICESRAIQKIRRVELRGIVDEVRRICKRAWPDLFMKLYCDWLQARIGGVGLVLKAVEYTPIHSVFQNCARLATASFRCVSLRLS